MSLELNQLVSSVRLHVKRTGKNSDLDIVVDIDNPTLSTMYTLKTVLTEMFHCEIDLVRFRSSLSPFLKQNIEKEAIYV